MSENLNNRIKFNADKAEEHFVNKLIEIRVTLKKIFDRDNFKNNSTNFVYSADYQKWLGMEIAMQDVLEYFSRFDLGGVEDE